MFGQIVIGPPGSGKTTYCAGLQQFLSGVERKTVIINLDPANDTLPYKCSVDMSELITLSDVMDNLKLGPNGALIYCMEYLEKNLDWLRDKLQQFKQHYLVFDCPGQVELYTHHNSVRNIVAQLQKWGYRLTAVNLVDSHYCSDPGKFISILLTSLCTMLQMELPHVNVLSKADLIEKFGKLSFNVDYYTDVMDLNFLLDHLQDDVIFARYKKLNEALVNLVEDYSLVSFILLNIQDKESVTRVLATVDKANGYVYGTSENRDIQSLLSCAVGAEMEYDKIREVREKYTDSGRTDSERTDSERTDSERTDSGNTDSGNTDSERTGSGNIDYMDTDDT